MISLQESCGNNIMNANYGKERGLYVPATTVHHKRTVREAPWLALTKSNCIAVYDECHYNIHHRQKPKWNDERW
jgi:hypothetical protein